MKKSLLFILLSVAFTCLNAQTLEELQAKKTELEGKLKPIQAEIDPIKSEIEALNGQIAKFPGWYKGSFGTVGLNTTGLNNWIANPNKNSRSTTILGSLNGFINKLSDKYFWRNNGSINVGFQKFVQDKNDTKEDANFKPVTDLLNVTSLYGYKLTSKLALSALGEYRSTLIENYNNPGYLDFGVGLTYTPISNLVIVAHPLNYNFVFADANANYTSSLGTKLVVDYNTTLYKGIKWRSNLSSFLSYKSNTPSLSSGTWTNGFSFTLIKGIGVGIEHAMRINRQESKDNQSYYIMGLSYAL